MGSGGWLILVLALIAAMGGKAWRRIKARVRTAAALELPGATAATALMITSMRQLDDHLAGIRCSCGGRLVSIGESSMDHEGRPLRVARLSCRSCEDERFAYFQLLS